jgi:hypothetical protein
MIHAAAMAITAEQHAQLATAYEKAAADGLAAPHRRAEFARKANCFRILARLAEKNERAEFQVTIPQELLKPPTSRLRAAFRHLLAGER